MGDPEFERSFRASVLAQLRAHVPRREIMTTLMSQGWTEAEAVEFLAGLEKEAPASAVPMPRRSSLGDGMPELVMGFVFLVAGLSLAAYHAADEGPLIVLRFVGGSIALGVGSILLGLRKIVNAGDD